MAYQLNAAESVNDALIRIAREQLGKAIAEIDDGALDDDKTVHQVHKRCKKLRGLLRAVRPALGKAYDKDEGFAAVAGGLRKTYHRGVKAMAAAYRHPNPESFHEWRKRTKYVWYQQRLLRPLWRAVLKQQCGATSELGELLGDDHDLAVLQERLISESVEAFDSRELEALIGLAVQRQLALRQQALPIGRRLFAEQPDALVARFRGYWPAWEAEHQSS